MPAGVCDKQMLTVNSEVVTCIGRTHSFAVKSLVTDVCMNSYQEKVNVQFSAEWAKSRSLRLRQL